MSQIQIKSNDNDNDEINNVVLSKISSWNIRFWTEDCKECDAISSDIYKYRLNVTAGSETLAEFRCKGRLNGEDNFSDADLERIRNNVEILKNLK